MAIPLNLKQEILLWREELQVPLNEFPRFINAFWIALMCMGGEAAQMVNYAVEDNLMGYQLIEELKEKGYMVSLSPARYRVGVNLNISCGTGITIGLFFAGNVEEAFVWSNTGYTCHTDPQW